MGNTSFFDLNDAETVQKWELELHVQAALRTPFFSRRYGFVGDGPEFLCQKRKKVWDAEAAGDGTGTRATVTLVRELRGTPTFGNQPLRDREETQNTATFRWEINQVRHATAVRGRATQKRVTWNIWKESLTALGTYWAKVTESAAMLHGAGVAFDVSTASEWYHKGNDLGHTFSNVPVAPDTKHILRINHEADTDDTKVGADPAAILDLDTISKLKAMAKSMPIPIRPCMIHGQELYVLFLHHYAAYQLKQNSQWLAMMKNTIQGGKIDGNPVWTGALGIWDEVLLVENPYVPPGLSSTNTRVANARRNIFCGAQAFVFGIAKEYDKDNMFQNDEENWDYRNNKGIAATSFLGLHTPRYSIVEQGTTEDYARIVCVSYAQELVTSA